MKVRSVGVIMGLLLFFSCGTDNQNLSDDEGLANSNVYLSIQPNGMSPIKVSSNDEEYAFPLTVKRNGGDKLNTVARLETWSEDELKAYNLKEKKSYSFLPSLFYSLSSAELSFSQGVSAVNAEVKFNPSRVFSEFKKTGDEYVIALKLSSEVKIRERQGDLLLPISFEYPTVTFTSLGLTAYITKEQVSVPVGVTFDYKVNGESQSNAWDFSCSFIVPSNAEELVTEYNKSNNTSYRLLSEECYDLSGKAHFEVGESEAVGEIILKREGMAVVDYLLPLQLGECSSEGVVCRSEICYLKVGRTYSNPIISDRSVADPTVIRAQDGRFYLYATQNQYDWMPIYSSTDLVNWTYEKNAFQRTTKPDWNPDNAFWAPEIRYINGKYLLYYSYAMMNGSKQSHTCVVTADTPLGTYTSEYPKGAFLNSRKLLSNEEFGANCIDQFYYEENGHKYLFFGSFTGIYVVELTDDGLEVKRDAEDKPVLYKKICGNAFEGTNIYKKGNYYYLFASIGSCCNGVNSSYQVVVGRSEDLLGPYVAKNGKGMLDNAWELVLEGDGKTWIGPGHNAAIIQDDEGTDWMIYHSYMKNASGGVGGRLGMLDRLLWSDDGWPYIENCVPSYSSLVPVFY